MTQAAGLDQAIKQAQKAGVENNDSTSESSESPGGVLVAPGVRFSDRLWSRLGGKTREIEKQKRRERLTDVTIFPDVPTSIFDSTFRRDAVWKQRELRMQRAYVEHLENLTLKRDDEKQALKDKILQQVTGVYKLAEEEALQRLEKHTKDVQARAFHPASKEPSCQLEKEAVMQCYKSNAENPLACAQMVASFERCANQARMAFVRSKTEK